MVASSSLKEYLKRYQSNNEDEKKKKKRIKEKPKAASMGGILVVDEDPVWQKPVKLDEEENEDDSADEAKPQVEEDIEVKRMKRLEQIRAMRPYDAISEDGSGWVSISDAPKQSDFDNERVDISPPRRPRARYDTPSPEPNQKPADSGNENPDLLRPRRQRRYNTPSPEPEQKPAGGNEVLDLSPPNRQRRRYDSSSPEPKLKPAGSGQEVSDLSPPRRRQRNYDISSPEAELNPMKVDKPHRDLFPPLRSSSRTFSEYEKKNSERSDLHVQSPQRIPKKNTDLSPPRRSRKDSGKSELSDLSPPPRRIHHSSLDKNASRVSLVADLSPPRKRRKDSEMSESPDLSPPRRIHQHMPKVDASRASIVADLSPPRKNRKDSSSLKERPKAGLVSRQDFREETAKLREDSARFKQMDPSSGGPGAEPVYRDKLKGSRISKEEFLKSQKKEEKPKEKQLEWGKGLAQKREAEARQRDLELEKDKPFARTRDDPELDKMLKERVRWGDPMAHLVKPKWSEPVLEDLGDEEKMKESGFVIPQDIPCHSWIKRRIDAPPNRYGIRPGRHWDGIDRSNGTEKQYFKRMNEKHATEREAYLWSVSDM